MLAFNITNAVYVPPQQSREIIGHLYDTKHPNVDMTEIYEFLKPQQDSIKVLITLGSFVIKNMHLRL